MDHNEALRKLEAVLEKQAGHVHATATELEALLPSLPTEKARQLVHVQVKAAYRQAKDLRELAQQVKET